MSAKFKKAIVSSGPTREWIDPVRFISNASSGKMGFHIASELSAKIPEVVYVAGNVSERYAKFDAGKRISVETTIEMRDAILGEMAEDTILVMAAAPADFRPIMTVENKIKKTGSKNMMIELTENPDILQSVKHLIEEKKYRNVMLVGFAAETEKLEEHAKEKLIRKGLSFIIGNYVDKNKAGFGELDSLVTVFSKEGIVKRIGPAGKEKIAKELIEFLLGSSL